MTTLELQKIIFPSDERLYAHWQLFYRGVRLVSDRKGGMLRLVDGAVTDFATYLNGFSIQKWSLYTNLKSLTLRLKVQGECEIHAVGYRLVPAKPETKEAKTFGKPDRHEFSSLYISESDAKIVEIPFPVDTDEQLLSFEIHPYRNCVLYGGSFYGAFDDSAVRDITLCLATTTCRKEEFIQKNVSLLKKELLSEQSDIRDHFFVHVVDNGRTLSKEEIEGFHVVLHPNKNVGGSGGFARGMMESMHQSPEATHVLLMDDDVLVLPESIRRTYTLLRVLKEEWREAFISGAMLEFGAMNIQHEDIGTVVSGGRNIPAKPRFDQEILDDVLMSDMEIPQGKWLYAAWWYCCIPVTQIKRNGLPLPLFVRGDDIEYGLRCRPGFISMAGVCVWHQGFESKFNVSTDFYQSLRNKLIARAVTAVPLYGVMGDLKERFIAALLSYYYGAAEVMLLALEDFMKGPSFIEQSDGERLLKDRSSYNEKLVSLSQIDMPVRLDHVYEQSSLSVLKRIPYRLTLNFQRWWPESQGAGGPAVIPFNSFSRHSVQFRHGKLLAVNPFERTASLRVQDRKRCRELVKRFHKDMSLYRRNRKRLEQEYSSKREWLTRETFWKQYLGI